FFQGVLRILKKATIPLVITGIVLSTLHQSSLGSLFLITPYRLHPLWYSPIIYVLFFTSAVGLGLMMVTLESLVSSWLVGHKLHMREIGGLGLAASVVLWIYLALRLGDLAHRGVLPQALAGSRQANLFLFEVGVSALLPAVLLLFRRVRASVGGMALCAVLTVSGMVLYRLDVSILAFARPEGFAYVPSWEEFAVSVGIVAAFVLTFVFFVEHLRVYDDVGPAARDGAEDTAGEDLTPPVGRSFDPATLHGLLPDRLAAPRRYSAAALAGAVVALAFLPVKGRTSVPVPAMAARSVEGVVRDEGVGVERVLSLAGSLTTVASDGPGEAAPLLLIDGNRNGTLVLFDHEAHVDRLGADTSCVTCHHMSLPLERNTSCAACHRDMYDTTSVFEHDVHEEALDGNDGCVQCHDGTAAVKSYETATACAECHEGEVHASSIIAAPQERWRAAASYTDAMHGLCKTCHERLLEEEPAAHPAELAQCRACHDADRENELRRLMPSRSEAAAAAGRGPTRAGGGGAP
ncbi:MAG: cytochrome c3 family protein, partial [Gemmatimonadota bacterium]